MVVKANIVKNQTISVDLNQKAGGFNAPVQSVNNKTGDVILDANDVGAVSKDELQATTNEILAQAKESGEFDGPQGEKGEKGDKGDTGLTGPQGPAGSDANVTAENINRALGYTPADRIALEELARRLNALADSDDVTLDQMSELVAYIKDNRELIESVTTNKVNVSDIINNLTTNVSNKPLSAAQGVALKSLIDALSDWTHQAVDEIVDFVSKDSAIESAFNLVSSNTLNWNGDTAGKLIAVNFKDPSLSYVRVSSVVPTLAELQKGGSWATTGADGIPYEQPFTSEGIVDGYTYINCFGGYVLIAKEDNVQFVDEYTDCTLPKAGIYFSYIEAEGYTSKLTITDYTGFAKPILKIDSLTPHRHDWYGKETNKGNTARSDDVIYGGFVKVSDAVPTLAEVQKGGTIRLYNVENNEITGGLQVEDYTKGTWRIYNSNGEIWIASDGIIMVQIKDDGVYFRQDVNNCIHSLTINGYEGFNYNFEKIPAELLPENTGGGVSSWNDLTDKPFGETTVMGDTLTWDGDTTGRVYVEMEMPIDDEGNTTTIYFVNVSDSVPTIEDLQSGGVITAGGQTVSFPDSEEPSDIGSAIMIGQYVLIAKEDSVDLTDMLGIILPKKGVYFVKIPMMGMYIESFTINNYTGFEGVEIIPLPAKYLPEASVLFTLENYSFGSGKISATATCNKTFTELWKMSSEKLVNALSIVETPDSKGVFKAITASKGVLNEANFIQIVFAIANGISFGHLTITLFGDGTIICEGWIGY